MLKSYNLSKSPPIYLTIIASLFPICFLFMLMNNYAVNIPLWDQWDIVYLFEKYHKNALSFYDFWKQHNEHRIVFPKLIFLGLGLLTNYNVIIEMMVSFFFAVLIYTIIVWHIYRNRVSLKIESSYRWIWIVLSYFIFSLSQWENWLWGFQLQWYLNTLAVVLGAFILSNYPVRFYSLFLLSLCGIIATFSLSSGLLYWIIILCFLMIYRIRISKEFSVRLIYYWIILFSMVIFFYFYDYKKPAWHPSLLFFLKDPKQFLDFFFTYLGNPLSSSRHSIQIFGYFCTFLYILFFLKQLSASCNRLELHSTFFFLIVGLYSILTALITALGRSGIGVSHATSSRYISISILIWISLFSLIFSYKLSRTVNLTIQRRLLKGTKIVILIIMFVCINQKSYRSIKFFQNTYAARTFGQLAVQYGSNIYGLRYLYPVPQRLKDYDIPLLKRLKLSVFSKPIAPVIYGFTRNDWRFENGWSFAGTPDGAQLNDGKDSNRYFFGSWSGSDSNTGRIVSIPLVIDRASRLYLTLSHGPDISNQKVGVKIIGGEKPVELICDLKSDPHSWTTCSFDLSDHVGKSFFIFAQDDGSGWGQWVAIGPAMLVSAQ